MLKTMQSAERDAIFAVADLMAAAAKTAPKGSGRDTIVTAIVSGETKDQLRDKLTELGTKYEEAFMVRDAGNVDNSTCVLLIGCTDTYMGLNHCSMCGFANCGETKKHGSPCVFNVSDLGIAVGSAVCVAADHRIDNRVMYSAGRAAVKLGLLGDNVKICYAIPLSTTNKSIYFDRNPGARRQAPGTLVVRQCPALIVKTSLVRVAAQQSDPSAQNCRAERYRKTHINMHVIHAF